MYCPLCRAANYREYHQDKRRPYMRCLDCFLVFVPPEFILGAESERKEYEKHENDPQDKGYRDFLSRAMEPLLRFIPNASSGLDFGCGPGPTLSLMLEEHGHKVELYDKFFYPNKDVFSNTYDFITATEVVEHLSDPNEVLNRLWGLLKPGAVLLVMTKLVIDAPAFAKWHYKNDPTHICFFSQETMHWLANFLKAEIQFFGKDVVVFVKA